MCSFERLFCSDELRKNREIRGDLVESMTIFHGILEEIRGDAVESWSKAGKYYFLWSITQKSHQNVLGTK